MALFNETLVQAVTTLIAQRQQRLGAALGYAGAPAPEDGPSPLQQELALLIGIANGAYARGKATAESIGQAEQALTHLLDLLLGNALQTPAMIPESFWSTEIGILVSRVRWWLSVDDLITISNAAALAFGENTQANRMRIARAMEKGLLDWVPDPSTVNPQQNKRVLRSQVERLREQRRLPE